MDNQTALEEKYHQLLCHLSSYKQVAIAYSGGVDSHFLLEAALRAACRVLAITVQTQLQPKAERERARQWSAQKGVEYAELEMDALDDPSILSNTDKRCYYCKKRLFTYMKQYADTKGYDILCDGTNADDKLDYRPGMQALQELGIHSPLLSCGWTKEQIRQMSKRLGLPSWDLPAYACLATRIPYGTPLTNEALLQVEQGEAILHGIGLITARLRHHGMIARIEVPIDEMRQLLLHAAQVEQALQELGFTYVAMDLGGYRMGSLNRGIKQEAFHAARENT